MKFKFVKVIECGFLSRYLHLTNINEQISMDMGGGTFKPLYWQNGTDVWSQTKLLVN